MFFNRRFGLARILSCTSVALLLTGPSLAQRVVWFDEVAKQAVVEETAEADRPYLLDVGARMVLPDTDFLLDFSRGRAEAYLQFSRPLTARDRGVYTLSGVRFYSALRSHTYRVKLSRRAAALVRRDRRFRGIEPVFPVDKLSEGLYLGQVHPAATLPGGVMLVHVRFYEDVGLEHALRVLDRWEVPVEDRSRFLFGERLLAEVTHGQALVLAEEPSVLSLDEIPVAGKTCNARAAHISNIDDVQASPFDLDGEGVALGEWDGGAVLDTHEQLVGRVILREDYGYNDHSTHVAGTLIGDGTGNAAAKGMAPAAGPLYSWDFDFGDVVTEQRDCVTNDGIALANHSWTQVIGWDDEVFLGNSVLFGRYTAFVEEIDAMVVDTGLLVGQGAGNDADDCNAAGTECDGELGDDGIRYGNIPPNGIAKNIFTVGSVDEALVLEAYSATGPTDDHRIKPDVVTMGDWLESAWAGGVTQGGCAGEAYCWFQGTSMATPVLTGGMALLVQQYRQLHGGANPSPELVKAVVVNTAVDLGRPGPDYAFGHGLFDALAAAEIIAISPLRVMTDAVDTGEVDTYLLAVSPGTAQLRVTAAWTDRPGTADSDDPDLVNDLDLELLSPGLVPHYPFSGPLGSFTDPATNDARNEVDNVESLYVEDPTPGFWTVRMKGTAVPEGPQSYAIAANTPFYLPDEPDIAVNANLVFERCPGTGPEAQQVTIFNTGGGLLLVHDVEETMGSSSFSISPNPSPPFAILPGAHVALTVLYEPSSPGLSQGNLRITSNDIDEGVLDLPMEGRGGAPVVHATLEAKGWFGHVPLGAYQTLELQIINQGLCNLIINDVQQAFGSTEFSVGEIDGVPAFPVTIFAGEAVSVMMKYEPEDHGADAATFNILSNDFWNSSVAVALTGECDPPVLSISGSLDFGEVCPGGAAEKELSLCNTGVSDLVVDSVGFDPACDDFTIVNNPFPAVVSHDFCLPVTVRYTPSGVGDHECTLEIVSNDPTSPVLQVTVTGTTPATALSVAGDVAFPPTVIQDVYACSSEAPFAVTNTGDCPVTITGFELVQPAADYSVIELPTLPVTLMPGEVLGEGDLRLVFAPEVVMRHSGAEVRVTYVSNAPATGDTVTVTRRLCGEATRTGVRVLVTLNDVPFPEVEHLELYFVHYPDTVNETLAIVTLEHFMPLLSEPAAPPCDAFEYHREWGAADDPDRILQPGTYQLNATIYDGGLHKTKVARFTLDTCTFFHDLRIDVDW